MFFSTFFQFISKRKLIKKTHFFQADASLLQQSQDNILSKLDGENFTFDRIRQLSVKRNQRSYLMMKYFTINPFIYSEVTILRVKKTTVDHRIEICD